MTTTTERLARPAGAISHFPGPKSVRLSKGLSGAAPSPAWQTAVIRLANAWERIAATLEKAEGVTLQDKARNTIAALIDLLDNFDDDDGDADHEDGGDDEPALGWTEDGEHGGPDDRESISAQDTIGRGR